jgi:hypothetical protein
MEPSGTDTGTSTFSLSLDFSNRLLVVSLLERSELVAPTADEAFTFMMFQVELKEIHAIFMVD